MKLNIIVWFLFEGVGGGLVATGLVFPKEVGLVLQVTNFVLEDHLRVKKCNYQ